MSEQNIKMTRCKACGAPFGAIYWDSVNTNRPDLVQAIINGKMFEIRCPKCGYTENVMFPLLFNDMKHGYMIWLTTSEIVEEVVKQLEWMPPNIRKRIVLTAEELREKVAILDAGLDDRAGEIYKLLTLLALEERGELRMENVVKALLVPEEGGTFNMMVFFNDGRSGGVQTTAELIARMTAGFSFRDDRMQEDLIVNGNWAVKYLQEGI